MRRGIVTGLIVWLVGWILLRPLLEFLGSHLFSMGPGLVSFVVDPIYRLAARGSRNIAGPSIILLAAGFSVGFASGLIEDAMSARRRGNLGGVSAPRPISTFFRSRSAIVLSLALALILNWSALTEAITLNMNISFQQRLEILSPFLTDLEEKQLKASWASMHSRKDFDKLNERLDVYARRYEILFPRPLPGY
jgi:hypothetical protein